MSGIVGSKFNHRGSGLVAKVGTDGQHLLSSGAGKKHVFETVAAAAYDDEPVKSDLTALAIREATNEASAAFNLPGSFIETFTDDTNLGTQTDCDRDSGYMTTETTAEGAFSNDANTLLLCHMDGSDDGTTFTDSSSNSHTITANGNAHTDTTVKKFGTASLQLDGTGDYLSIPDSANWDISATTNYTIEFWIYPTSNDGDRGWIGQVVNDTNGWYFRNPGDGSMGFTMWSAGSAIINIGGSVVMTDDEWQHLALVKEGNDYEFFRNGISTGTATDASSDTFSGVFTIGSILRTTPQSTDGYIDEVRISDVARYTSSFTPSAVTVTNATGTLIQSANAVTGTRTKVGGTMLYKDNAGTATLGTDLKIYFTCDGGSNWTEAASYNAITPVYSSGIKQVRLGETTCTGGTDVRYKAVWGNQSDSSKETHLHAIGTNY